MNQFLPADAMHFLIHLVHGHGLFSLLPALVLWILVAGFLRLRLRQWSMDVIFFALLISAALIFIGACLHMISIHHYHFLGS
jgi:hypothetical protein